ncbi:MAG: hypothetical protein GXO54_04940, partial [Chloroflexi bacterium]|nr:hypothetical protein [Chloroflexota bacterium]
RVEIKVTGQPNTRREALAYIREHFEAIHRTFVQKEGGFTITAYIRPRDYPGLRLSYERLLVLEKSGVRETDEVWQGSAVHISVREVLDGFVAPRDRFEELKARYPEEAERMAAKYEKHIHIEIHGNVQDSVLNAGDENTIRQRMHKPATAPELAQALAELSRAVQAMLPHLPPERREEVQDDLARLQEELQKPKPRRKWYSVSLEGLKDAAKTVGEIGLPVLRLADQILRMLP